MSLSKTRAIAGGKDVLPLVPCHFKDMVLLSETGREPELPDKGLGIVDHNDQFEDARKRALGLRVVNCAKEQNIPLVQRYLGFHSLSHRSISHS